MGKVSVDEAFAALEENCFTVFRADDASHAGKIVLTEIVPEVAPEIVSFGDSMTLTATGALDALRQDPAVEFIDTFERGVERNVILERRRRALLSDLFLMGTNAVTVDGKLVNLDMVGNRVGGLVYGPRHVVVVAGANKLVPDLDAAMARIRNTAAPENARRHGSRTPCAKTGTCMDCKSPDRICNVWTITEKSWPTGRIKVILVNEKLGL